MDKEKQIEEMARIIMYCPFIDADSQAKALYDKGYRKINENDIVFSKSEHQHYLAYKLIEPQIKGCLDRERELERRIQELEGEQKSLISRERAQTIECKTIFNLRKQAKKELKAFAEELKHTLIINNEENTEFFDYYFTLETIDEIAKKYGVNMGEKENG